MILIDVRTKREYDGGHIEKAINYDIMQMMQGVYPEINRDEDITLYCESGNRSMMAKNMMDSAGFTKVKDGGSIDNFK